MKPLLLALLATALGFPLGALEPSTTLLPEGGTYPAPLTLSLQAPASAQVTYRFLESDATLEWDQPVVLDCLPGESRVYRLRVTTERSTGETSSRDFQYQVSRPAPLTASVQPEPGTYWSAISVKPTLPPGWRFVERGVEAGQPRVLDAPPGQVASMALQALGPAGQSLMWNYTVDRRDQESTALDVISPIPGQWANPQPLVVVFRGLDEVKWNYGTSSNPASAQDYVGPVSLPAGTWSVTVSGRMRSTGARIERTVSWTSLQSAAPSADWPDSGVQTQGLSLPSLPGWTVSWDNRTWQSDPGPVSESSSLVARKILALMARKDGKTYRYLYWLDARAPLAPTAEFVGGWNPRVVFFGSAEAFHRVTWTNAAGQSVVDPSLRTGPVGSWKVPDGIVAARVQAVGSNGIEGPSVTVGFSETGWSVPSWEPWDTRGPQVDRSVLPLGGRIPPRPGFWPVYEVSDRPDVREPNTLSPLLEGGFFPSVPRGSDRTFYVRFAWRDATGLVGPATSAYAVRVDRVAPQSPTVLVSGGKVLLLPAEGEEEGTGLSWALSKERVNSLDVLTYQPYTGPLDLSALRSGAGQGNLWIHAVAQDRAGNTGAARLNVALLPASGPSVPVVQVDSNPSIGEIPVENGGVYPWSSFRLRAVDQTQELWANVTDAGQVPSDWATRVQPWTGVLSRGIAQGERRSFLLYWNAKTAAGWAWPEPKTLVVTLDQSAPQVPEVRGAWPSAPLGSSWTLDLKPARAGDALRYTVSVDGSIPSDPRVGELWPGSKTWDVPGGSKAEIRLRMAVVSVSGLAVELSLGGPVLIDRTLPSLVVPGLEPFTYRTAPLVLTPPPGGGVVRYTITTDGQLPEVPSERSPAISTGGMVLEGVAGKSALYRFRWRHFSAAGIAGPATDSYSVLIDRNPAPQTDQGSANLAPVAVTLQGLPPSGLSSVPVQVKVSGYAPLVRYELREGLGVPRPVTPASMAWTDPLVLDGGPGVDRSYAVSIRAFSPEGVPLSEEVTGMVRVDRSLPAAPRMAVRLDPRRPEAALDLGSEPIRDGETFFYRWSWVSFPQGQGEGSWTKYSPGTAVFSAPDGALTRLKVEGYWIDEAGNQGPLAEQSTLIDQNVVYLAQGATGDGSRDTPVGDVTTAVEKARREGRSIVLVTAGSYSVSRTINLGGLQVYAGLKMGSWETTPEPGRSTLVAVAPFSGTILVESGREPWSLRNLDLSTGTVRLASVVSVQGADVTVRHSTWTWSGAGRGWDQQEGRCDWSNIAVTYAAEPNGTLLDWNSVTGAVRGLRLTATQNQGGVLFALKKTSAVFQDLLVVSKKALGYDGVWSATDSELTVDRAEVQAGEGAERVVAVLLRGSDASFWNTSIALYGSRSNTGFQVSGGRLEVQKGNLDVLRGQEFNQGLVTDRADLVLRSFRMSLESGAYQGALTMDGGSLDWFSGTVKVTGGGQKAWGGQFLSATLVSLRDVSWSLLNKTPGELWRLEVPWTEGSKTIDLSVSGW